MFFHTKLPLLILGFGAAMFLSACQPVASPLLGMIYNETKYGDTVTSHDAGTKEGKSCATSVLGIVATGDASIQAAKNNGGITVLYIAELKAQPEILRLLKDAGAIK